MKTVKTVSKIREAGLILSALGIIGFIGLVFLMIFGNLSSSNLGFAQDSGSFSNQTIVLISSGNTPAGVAGKNSTILTSVVVTNASGGTVLTSGNYTISGGVISSTSASNYNNSNVNVSYSATFDGTVEEGTQGVIRGNTSGFSTFFGFSNTFFTIAAITLLITLLLGVLFLVINMMQKRKSKFEDS